MAYRKKFSVKDNAFKHKDNCYFLKLDFENFFPSIKFRDFWPLILEWHKTYKVCWEMNNDVKELIKKTCFYKKEDLPIGYPSSPIISNIVMFNFDSILERKFSSEKAKYGNVIYTRYADDLVFSTDITGASNDIFSFVKDVVKTLSTPKLKLNNKKTRFSSRTGGSAFITGLRVCRDGHLTIHRKYKDRIRRLFFLFKKDLISEQDCLSLKGHVNYIRYVDPAFYNKLQRKYFEYIDNL